MRTAYMFRLHYTCVTYCYYVRGKDIHLSNSYSIAPVSPPRTAGRLWRGSGGFLPACRSLTDRKASFSRGGSGPWRGGIRWAPRQPSQSPRQQQHCNTSYFRTLLLPFFCLLLKRRPVFTLSSVGFDTGGVRQQAIFGIVMFKLLSKADLLILCTVLITHSSVS